MKINQDPRFPTGSLGELTRFLSQQWRLLAAQVNGMSEGAVTASYNATTAPPSTGVHERGDFIKNSAPIELGTAGSKYIVDGWRCVASGSPGTWVQCRYLTGN